MSATRAQLEAVAKATEFLLGARQDQMLTIEEWVCAARAVAIARGRRTAELLTVRDLDDVVRCDVDWDAAVDGPLPVLDDE